MRLADWIGRTETATDTITPTPVAALAATLDRAAAVPAPGTVLPPLWHWLFFLPLHRRSEIGEDGHAARGGFLPPVPLPRRMWAGSQITFHDTLRVGDAVRRRSTIADVTEKSGRSGSLVFVKVRHDVVRAGQDAPAITEFHDIVYRGAPQPGDPAPAPQAAPDDAAWERRWTADAVLMFRYSALTFNGHRIHYDRRYATEVEGYPGLVVHGPLIATLLLDLLRDERAEDRVASFRFRALRPTFDINPFFVCGRPAAEGRGAVLWARDHDGWLTMDAAATFA